MAKNIEPSLKKIGSYLKTDTDTIFVIPEYQRAYSWGTDRCEKLWNDIVSYSEAGDKDPYFFGTVILSCEKGDSELYLIDGQQRTTTFFLLLKALLGRVNNGILHTENDTESAELCRGLRQRRREIIQILYKVDEEDIPDRPDPDYDVRLYQSVALFKNESMLEQFKGDFNAILTSSNLDEAERNVTKLPGRKLDNKYSNFFRNYKFFTTEIAELSDSEINTYAKTIIKQCEIIEIRSWQLEQAITMFNSLNSDNLPLRDADIISSKLFAAAKSAGVDQAFRAGWEGFIERSMALENDKIGNIDAILMQYMYYIRALNNETISDTGSVNVTTPGLRRYFTDLNKTPINQPMKFTENVTTLANNWSSAYQNFPSVQIMLKFNENAKLFFASFLMRFDGELPTEEVELITESMIRLFAVMEILGANYSSKHFKTFLFKEQIKLLNPMVSAQEISDDFVTHITDNWTEKQIQDGLSDYSENALVYLNEYLYAKAHDVPFSLLEQYDIEHIMPVSGRNVQPIRDDAGMRDKDEFDAYINKLGNKILLEYNINRSIGNEWFRTKVSTSLKDKTGYIDSNYPLAIALVRDHQNDNKAYWTKSDIDTATAKASTRILDFIFKKH